MFCEKDILEDLTKFTVKHLCQSLFVNIKFQCDACNFIKKEALTQVFSCEFYELFKNTFFIENLWAAASECSISILPEDFLKVFRGYRMEH